MIVFLRVGVAALLLSVSPAVLAEADEAVALKEENARLRTLVRQHAAGMTFPNIESKAGKSFQEVVITVIADDAVNFRHAGGEGSLTADDCPAVWAELFGFTSASAPATAEASKLPAAVSETIAVIEGDRSTGTGFFCRAEGKVYLYSAAHVLSGNSRLKVKLRDGTVVRKFGPLESAEGADLIRLEVLEAVPATLEIAAESGVAAVGVPVLASGNAGGGGTVGFESGKIMGVGPESIEIDADVIQGNSGGPILHGTNHQAMGVVTHLTAARKDLWAKKTRYADVRRFGCRLDRTWKWKQVSVELFLKEGKTILAVQEQSELMTSALQPDKWKDPVFQQQRDNPLARDIAALETWITQQAQRVSEPDRKKRLRGIFESARHRSRGQMAAFKCEDFTWFHRETATRETLTRDEIDKAYESTLQDLR